ncbi:uncharacterized protein BDV17DRAFT_265772 [Aspergillus undulatus]|uniref:uncharacterized protein n=1 Tax=Aspergillus undulatus TaxID=1810928 RepID=UPI003CCE31C9
MGSSFSLWARPTARGVSSTMRWTKPFPRSKTMRGSKGRMRALIPRGLQPWDRAVVDCWLIRSGLMILWGPLGSFNSGLLGYTPDAQESLSEEMIIEEPNVIREVQKPVLYSIGVEGGVAYPAATADYQSLAGVPKWIGNYTVGHSGRIGSLMAGSLGLLR